MHESQVQSVAKRKAPGSQHFTSAKQMRSASARRDETSGQVGATAAAHAARLGATLQHPPAREVASVLACCTRSHVKTHDPAPIRVRGDAAAVINMCCAVPVN